MNITLSSPLTGLAGIGDTRAARFARLGIHTVGELLLFFPRRYENRGNVSAIAETGDGTVCSLMLQIDAKSAQARGKSGITYTKLSASDGTGAINITLFNQPWVAKSLTVGRIYRIYGKVVFGLYGREMTNPIIEAVLPGRRLADIVPVYPLTGGLTQKAVSDAVRQALPAAELLEDPLPEELAASHSLLGRAEAVKNIHFPKDEETLSKARRTVAFCEMLIFQLAVRHMRESGKARSAFGMTLKGAGCASFFASLPFKLTGAQERAVKEIYADMTSGNAMMRLVQGDVGSGKTAVAAAAVYLAVKNGCQAAMMAPTEVLAAQHYRSLCSLFAPFGFRVELLSGSLTKKQKTDIHRRLADGEIDVAVGTNALIQQGVSYKRLGLAVTDEQHRFGVIQRAALINKSAGGDDGPFAHTLVMSATPIPRTLSLILYGDLDVSVLDELPPGRQKIDTFLVDESYRSRIYSFIKKELAASRQAFIICPLVEDDGESDEKKAVTEYTKRIEPLFAPYRVACVHGRQKSSEKDAVMREFSEGRINVLVSTTVVEVGVDVPNASVMLIENAECFGLSQLHQLRGRVGRGKAKSYCILMSSTKSGKSKSRLEIMTKTNDGFEIANADLELRGPGDFIGSRQSGEIKFKCASVTDMALIEETKALCGRLYGGLYTDERLASLARAVNGLFDPQEAANTLN